LSWGEMAAAPMFATVLNLFSGRQDVELNFSLSLPDSLYEELIAGCQECSCSPKQFAAESLESVLASRRLPRVTPGSHGPHVRAGKTEEVEPDGT
jgi:hypothetical protein